MRNMIITFGLLAVLMVSVVTLVAAVDVPGVTEDKIRVGMIADLTGPVALGGQEISAGARLYVQHINHQGGVHGRQIELLVEDDGYQPPRTIAALRKLVDRDRVFCFVGNVGSSTTMATFPLLQQEQIPLLFPLAFNTSMYTPPRRYVFALDPTYAIQSWIMVKYILDIEYAESPRLAVLYQDDDYGRDGLRGLRDAAAHHDLPIVAEASYRAGAVDFSTQVLNLKQSGATHVILWTLIREAAAILREARQMGWHPQFIGGNTTGDDQVVELAGSASRGFKATALVDIWGDSEKARQYHRLIEKYDPGHRPVQYHSGGFAVAQGLVEVLRRAGRNLTREKLVEAAESFRGWDGGLGPPMTYGPNLRGGKSTAAIMIEADIEQMRFVRATDWIPFEMPDRLAQKGSR